MLWRDSPYSCERHRKKNGDSRLGGSEEGQCPLVRRRDLGSEERSHRGGKGNAGSKKKNYRFLGAKRIAEGRVHYAIKSYLIGGEEPVLGGQQTWGRGAWTEVTGTGRKIYKGLLWGGKRRAWGG